MAEEAPRRMTRCARRQTGFLGMFDFARRAGYQPLPLRQIDVSQILKFIGGDRRAFVFVAPDNSDRADIVGMAVVFAGLDGNHFVAVFEF